MPVVKTKTITTTTNANGSVSTGLIGIDGEYSIISAKAGSAESGLLCIPYFSQTSNKYGVYILSSPGTIFANKEVTITIKYI